ncbi:MAG: trypsin-like peptidase domain-containing protein [Pseudomonadota bacterium]
MKILRYGFFISFFLVYTAWIKVYDSFSYVDELRRTPVVKAVENSKASVVSISTHEQVYERENPFSRFGRDPFFERFFQDFYEDDYQQESVRTHLGSGVIIDASGFVLTNWHVVEKASAITIATNEDKEFSAVLVGADQKSDLAVLKIESQEKFSQIPLGDSDDILIGETVIAIGNPFGLSHTVTTGVVSALHRSIKSNEQIYEDFMQTDASINPGNSGGPLLNIKGELIGINTAIYGEAQGIGFAIPINAAKRIVDNLLKYGEVRPPWTGIAVDDLTRKTASALEYKGTYGVAISEIEPGSPGEKSGLITGDILVSIGDQKVKSKTAFKRLISLYTANNTIKMEISRHGETKTFSVQASEFPPHYMDSVVANRLGMEIIDNSGQIARSNGLASASGPEAEASPLERAI